MSLLNRIFPKPPDNSKVFAEIDELRKTLKQCNRKHAGVVVSINAQVGINAAVWAELFDIKRKQREIIAETSRINKKVETLDMRIKNRDRFINPILDILISDNDNEELQQ